MNSATITCIICGEDIFITKIQNHIPKCYRNSCLKDEILPLCTCNQCEGKVTHPGDHLKDGIPTFESATSSSKMSTSLDFSPFKQESNFKNPIIEKYQLNYDKLCGKQCIICGKKKSPKAVPVPFIYIGSYRIMMVCKKNHLIETESCGDLIKLIDHELAQIEKFGDTDSLISITSSPKHHSSIR